MDQVYVVRHKVLVEGISVRQVARQLGVSRNTVRRYVEGAEPGVRKPVVRPAAVKDGIRPVVEAILGDSSRWTQGKQRLTAKRLHEMLVVDGHQVGETVVKELVREWKRQRQEVFVPLVYRPGDLAEVDFFEVYVDIDGQRQKAWMFVMRLMYSGRDFAWLYPRQDQVCFFDGHVRAFAHFAAVPLRIVYDNLRSAVRRVLVGADGDLSTRFAALTAHYLFEPCFARPGTGHDKGGVEARGKGIRWQELVPIPAGPDLATLSEDLLGRLDARTTEKRDAQGRSVAERFAEETVRMLPLAAAPFRPSAFRSVRVSRRGLCKVEGAHYSVWSRWAGLDISVYVGVDQVELVGPDDRVVHRRQRPNQRSVDYRHYVRELSRKPQALRQVADELVRDLGEPFDALWRQLVETRGPKEGSRVFAQVLRAFEKQPRTVVERIVVALATGEPVLLALRPPEPPQARVAADDLPQALSGVTVAAASAADYDVLVGGAP